MISGNHSNHSKYIQATDFINIIKKIDEEGFSPLVICTSYTSSKAILAIDEMQEKKVTKNIQPYRQEVLNIFSHRINEFCKKAPPEENLPDTLTEELAWLMAMNLIAIFFSKINNIFTLHLPRREILDETDLVEKYINYFYSQYPEKMLKDTDNVFKKDLLLGETLLKLYYEARYLKTFDTLHSELETIAKTYKTDKHANALNNLIKEGYSIKHSMPAKIVYEKLLMLTNAYKDLIEKDYNKSSFLSYSNNSLWNNGFSIKEQLEKAIKHVSSLEPIMKYSEKKAETAGSFKVGVYFK